ncbi:phospholipase D-like domain-containing protein [Orrella sp. 11846]|uniref:phospholipase D-like domain-containing protein n=1 Tax=Orrella sp. 11846 TaxID=3409913 RepID=UPI003B596C8E
MEFSDDFHLFLQNYWPHVVLIVTLTASVAAAIHAAMTKDDVRAAIGWVAIVIFSPLLGAIFYFFAGINRIRQERVTQQRVLAEHDLMLIEQLEVRECPEAWPEQTHAMLKAGDSISRYPLLKGNAIELLNGGDQTYPAMLNAIYQAKKSIALQSYIFDHDHMGERIAKALVAAQERGVEVRVLIDAVGSKYSRPPIIQLLREHRIPAALFLPTAMGMRLAYANLRSHRKVLVVDGELALAGGMNIRESFTSEFGKDAMTHDTHFRIRGPATRQLMDSFAHDWEFTTSERLDGEKWFSSINSVVQTENTAIRVVPSGPDKTLASNQHMVMAALSTAKHHVRIQSPYFLPDIVLIGALTTAARRGVIVDVVIPGNNNLKLVSAAMDAQLDQMVAEGVRIWASSGTFDHSKLMTVDGFWTYAGSSNLDPRSLRLNFELDLEVYNAALTQQIEARIDQSIATAHQVTLEALQAKPFGIRLRNRLIWLATPYL